MGHINKIAKIEIVFENVEFVTIPADNIVKFCIDIMHRSIQIEIDGENSDKTTFDRILRYNDVVWIEVLCNDGKTYKVDVPWRNSTVGGEENALQKSWIKNNGNLCVSIVEGKR